MLGRVFLLSEPPSSHMRSEWFEPENLEDPCLAVSQKCQWSVSQMTANQSMLRQEKLGIIGL